mmetsp:Transcript_112023/g.317191  ORF Transcript_112023/g.317191 Transcript_112023/m.317191 type:complete len:373 (+) Transcript_112023:1-1119(+)
MKCSPLDARSLASSRAAQRRGFRRRTPDGNGQRPRVEGPPLRAGAAQDVHDVQGQAGDRVRVVLEAQVQARAVQPRRLLPQEGSHIAGCRRGTPGSRAAGRDGQHALLQPSWQPLASCSYLARRDLEGAQAPEHGQPVHEGPQDHEGLGVQARLQSLEAKETRGVRRDVHPRGRLVVIVRQVAVPGQVAGALELGGRDLELADPGRDAVHAFQVLGRRPGDAQARHPLRADAGAHRQWPLDEHRRNRPFRRPRHCNAGSHPDAPEQRQMCRAWRRCRQWRPGGTKDGHAVNKASCEGAQLFRQRLLNSVEMLQAPGARQAPVPGRRPVEAARQAQPRAPWDGPAAQVARRGVWRRAGEVRCSGKFQRCYWCI